jgi:hypothetical protein
MEMNFIVMTIMYQAHGRSKLSSFIYDPITYFHSARLSSLLLSMKISCLSEAKLFIACSPTLSLYKLLRTAMRVAAVPGMA